MNWLDRILRRVGVQRNLNDGKQGYSSARRRATGNAGSGLAVKWRVPQTFLTQSSEAQVTSSSGNSDWKAVEFFGGPLDGHRALFDVCRLGTFLTVPIGKGTYAALTAPTFVRPRTEATSVAVYEFYIDDGVPSLQHCRQLRPIREGNSSEAADSD